MTNKDILKMATNGDILYYLDEIKKLNDNQVNQVGFEISNSRKQIKKYVGYIREIMEV